MPRSMPDTGSTRATGLAERKRKREPSPVPGRGRERERGPGGGLARSGSQRRLVRSSSVDREGGSLRHGARAPAQETAARLGEAEMADFSVVAVYSREAFENFGRAWRARMSANLEERATRSSRQGRAPEEIRAQVGRLSGGAASADVGEQLQKLLENRSVPHVIAVLEGSESASAVSLQARVGDRNVPLGYTRVRFEQGATSGGLKDDKQSATFYVRDDLKSAYAFTPTSVAREGGAIPAVGVDYRTADGTRYRSLVVHIPNRFAGTKDLEDTTHAAFQHYADEARAQAAPVIITGYQGDTNFRTARGQNTTPSIGGHLPDGSSLRPQASSAQGETHFMQSVPLDGKGPVKHEVLQPATLNYVFPTPDAQNRATTDHPSMVSFTAHTSEIVGRNPVELPAYYA